MCQWPLHVVVHFDESAPLSGLCGANNDAVDLLARMVSASTHLAAMFVLCPLMVVGGEIVIRQEVVVATIQYTRVGNTMYHVHAYDLHAVELSFLLGGHTRTYLLSQRFFN